MLITLNLDIIISLIFSTIIFIFLIWLFVLKSSPKAHFLRKIGGGYQLVKTKSYKLKAESIKYGKLLYELDLEKAIRWKKGKPHLFFEIDNAVPLSYTVGNLQRNAKMFNTLTDNTLISSMFSKQTEKILIFIVMILVIALMVSISFNMYMVQNPEQFIEIAQNTTNTPNISPIIP